MFVRGRKAPAELPFPVLQSISGSLTVQRTIKAYHNYIIIYSLKRKSIARQDIFPHPPRNFFLRLLGLHKVDRIHRITADIIIF